MLFSMPGVDGATHVVDDDSGTWQDYSWIQDAINASSTGDTIEVYEGAYTGRLIVDEEVTITGNGTGSVFTATGAPAAGVYDIEIDASNVVIENMLLDFNGPADGRGGQGIVVSDYDDPARNDVVIRDCAIYSGDGSGVGGTCIQTGKWADVTGLVVRDNVFYLDWDNMGEGVYINPHNATGNHTIYNNEFYGYVFSAVSLEMGNVDVVGNTINSNTSQGIAGVRMIDLTGGEAYSGVTVSWNDIQGVGSGVRVGTSTDVGSSLTATISNNTLTGNERGIWARYGAEVTVRHNNISDNRIFGDTLGSLNEGLVGYWKLDTGSGSSAIDETWTSNGTITAASWVSGKYDDALDFDGSADYVNIPHDDSHVPSQTVTAMAWVNIDGTTGDHQVIISKWSDTNDGSSTTMSYVLELNPDARTVRWTTFISSTTHVLLTSDQVDLNTWTHLAGTYDGQTKRIYVNGEEWASYSTSGSFATNQNDLRIGGHDNTGDNNWFDGTIDDVRIYNWTLGQSDINTIYKKGVGIEVAPSVSDSEFTNNTITGNGRHGIAMDSTGSSGCRFNYNNISGNHYGFNNSGTVSIDAEYNWWGASDGPSGEGSGSGDSVTEYVDFEPWYSTPTVTPSTEYVNVTYNPVRAVSDTIQGGIDAATSGDTIAVSAGTYYENPTVDKTLTIVGAGRDTTFINGSGTGDVLSITADDVNLTAVTVTNSGSSGTDAGIHLDTVQDCHIWDVNMFDNDYGIDIESSTSNVLEWANCSENDIGVYIQSSAHNNYVGNNTFYSSSTAAIHIQTLSQWLTIENNTIVEGTYGIRQWGGASMDIWHNSMTNTSSAAIYVSSGNNFDISYNIISSSNTGIDYSAGSGDIHDNDLDGQNTATFGIYNRGLATITDNEVSGYFDGAYLSRNGAMSDVSGNLWHNNTNGVIIPSSGTIVTLTGDTFRDNTRGVYMGNADTISLPSNEYYDNTYGIYILTTGMTVNQIQYSFFSGNTWGLYNQGDAVTAERNYWGAIDGPSGQGSGSGDAVSTNVDFEPWYATATVTSSTEYVVISYNPVRAYADTIQSGIDAATIGDTVTVSSGTYFENPIIYKSITLAGTDMNTTYINGSNSGIVVNITADWVSVKDLTISGSGASGKSSGIRFFRVTGGNVTWCNLSYNYIGIFISSSSDISIRNNTIIKNGDRGILAQHADGSTVAGNNLSKNGYEGMRVWLWSNNTMIESNTVYDNYLAGIFVGQSSYVKVSENWCELNTHAGIYLWNGSSSSTIANNTCVNNDRYGIRLYEDTNNNVVDNNTCLENWEYGIYIYDSDSNIVKANNCSLSDSGIYIRITSGSQVHNNVISWNSDYGVRIDTNTGLEINNNSIHNNTLYAVYNSQTNDVSATYNHWGTISEMDILSLIYDENDNPIWGTVAYSPWWNETFDQLYYHDTTAPSTFDDYDGTWRRFTTQINLTAFDLETGVLETYYRVDGGPWRTGNTATVNAPSDHSADGLHYVEYGSIDNIGNNETAHNITVRIDTTPPEMRIFYESSTDKLRKYATDELDPSPARIKKKAGTTFTYIITDHAGNVAKFKLQNTKSFSGDWKILKVRFVKVKYNNGAWQSFTSGERIAIKTLRTAGTTTDLLQVAVGDGWRIDATYTETTGNTEMTIQDGGTTTPTYAGIKTATVRTLNGVCNYNIPT